MKRLAAWAGACIGAVIVQVFVTYQFLAPYTDNYLYRITWSDSLLGKELDTGIGWRTLTPHYAWPILAIYGGALVVLGTVIVVAIGRSIILKERQAIAAREAAASLQEEQARIAMEESERIRRAARNQIQSAKERIEEREHEADTRVEEAEARLEGSVGTNIGRQKTIQKLRERKSELEAENQELKKRLSELEGEE